MHLSALAIFLTGHFVAQAPFDLFSELEGKWKSTEVHRDANGKTTEFSLDGQNVRILAGSYLQINETLKFPDGQTSANHILIAKPTPVGEVSLFWFAPNVREPMVFKGKIDGRKLVLIGAGTPVRISYDFTAPGSYVATVDRRAGEDWARMVDAQYTRQKSGER